MNDGGHADASGHGERLQACRDVDTIPVNVFIRDDHIAEVDPNAKDDVLSFRGAGVPLNHSSLNRDRAGYRLYDTGKLYQDAVAGGLDDATSVLGDFGINHDVGPKIL
jgi:hypothetical protein